MKARRYSSRAELEAVEATGACPDCLIVRDHADDCRKKWFDWGYTVGYHDGANNMERHKDAFVVEMMERGDYAAYDLCPKCGRTTDCMEADSCGCGYRSEAK